jgi:exopolyphosphatase/guanosine-5'-triphosphate,3'-diphosphate pyrophosphatase
LPLLEFSQPVHYESLAAVDLGSNSFHLQIGRVVDDQIYPLDALREPVRLAAGLTRDRHLDRATQLRAIETLARFGERLRGFPPDGVRAVGTKALRVAKNAPQFLEDARVALGFPIEVLYGREEARLIYMGVSHSLPVSLQRRFVVDIGGGSTEFIIGTGFEPALTESLSLGCVTYSLDYFPDGRIDKASMKKATLAAGNEVQRIVGEFRATGWQEAVASSGMAKTIASVLQGFGWADGAITAVGLERLRAHLVKSGDILSAALPNVRNDRLVTMPGGIAVMCAVFDTFELERVQVSEAALRQGVLYDLLGRVQHRDMRQATVEQYVRRYHVEPTQAQRVGALARQLYDSLADSPSEADARLLEWAAQLHEIGLSIAHAGYHKHSAYVLTNADMPGFSKDEQMRLARVVLAHRGKLTKLASLPARSPDWTLILSLRLAALIHRSRTNMRLPRMQCRPSGSGFQLTLPRHWLEAHPLTAAALETEAREWQALGLKLDVRENGAKGGSQNPRIA